MCLFKTELWLDIKLHDVDARIVDNKSNVEESTTDLRSRQGNLRQVLQQIRFSIHTKTQHGPLCSL